MALDEKKEWRCRECGTVTLETELLTAPSPFDAADTLTACPECKEVNDFYEVCDEPGCTREACCGFPAGPEFGGYRRTCFEHSQWARLERHNAEVRGEPKASPSRPPC